LPQTSQVSAFPSSRCASTSHAQFFRATFELFTDAIYRRQTQRTQFGVDAFGWLRIKVALEICHNFLRRAVFVKALDLGARGLLDVLEFLLLRLRAPLRLGVEDRFERALFEKAQQLVFLAIGPRSPRARADVPIGALRYRGVGVSGRSASGTTSIVSGK
jgi:hypothetical protein